MSRWPLTGSRLCARLWEADVALLMHGTFGTWRFLASTTLHSMDGNLRMIALARIMHDGEKLRDGCGKKRAIHVANRCPNKLHRVSALRHSRHDRRYAASLRPSICPAQEPHN